MPDPHFPKLNDTNYTDWHYIMAATLVEKDLWDVVDGSLTCPVGSPNHKAVKTFMKKQQLTCAKNILSIKVSQLPHTHHDDPKVIWDSLQKVHQAHGFATHLSLHHCFLYMHKQYHTSFQHGIMFNFQLCTYPLFKHQLPICVWISIF